MKLIFESDYDFEMKKIYKIKININDDIEEFERILKRLNRKYLDDILGYININDTIIKLTKKNDTTYIMVSDSDITRDIIDELVKKIMEVKTELSKQETIVYNI